ncbi:MAG: hypothetical protein WB615_14200 [Candidatus Tumulicola sp.]
MKSNYWPRAVALSTALAAGCSSGASPLPFAPAAPGQAGSNQPASAAAAHASSDRKHAPVATNYIYVSDRERNELLVYSAHGSNPRPVRAIGATQGIVQIGGVAVDRSGDVYVANGSGGDVLEFDSGAQSLVKKYSKGLNHPVNLAVDAQDMLYVVDQDAHYASGATSAIVEYPSGADSPATIIYDPSSDPLRAIAVDSRGSVLASTSAGGDVWPPPVADCSLPPNNTVYDFIFPTLIMPMTLKNNTQIWGLAVDSHDALYASDFCRQTVQKYARSGGKYLGNAAYSCPTPGYQTVSWDHMSIVPCAGAGTNGSVAIVDGLRIEATITNGLRSPIGAAAGP